MRRSREETLPLTLREEEAEKEAAAEYKLLWKSHTEPRVHHKPLRRIRVEAVPLTDAEREAEAECEIHTLGRKLPF